MINNTLMRNKKGFVLIMWIGIFILIYIILAYFAIQQGIGGVGLLVYVITPALIGAGIGGYFFGLVGFWVGLIGIGALGYLVSVGYIPIGQQLQ